MARQNPIPVIDLFAGPGGLGEGFSSIVDGNGERHFALRVSIEKDPVAHRTLSLRALFRAFRKGAAPDCYYDYVRGEISREDLFSHPSITEEARFAASEAKNAELGKTPHEEIDGWIEKALDGAEEWVLIGGPPCQAYSLAGRSRRAKEDTAIFESDKRHFLYTEYLRIIRRFGPSVFVMENVKGILSSTHGGSSIFDRILADLASPGDGLEYRIRSFVVEGDDPAPQDFVIEAERFGVPQNRHRVILFGIRSDLADTTPALTRHPERFVLKASLKPVGVKAALSGLPPLRSRLSREPDSHDAWLSALKSATEELKGWHNPIRMDMEEAMSRAWRKASAHSSIGGRFDPRQVVTDSSMPTELRSWFHDPRLRGVLQHDTRSHMRSDLHRYLFASCYAATYTYSPKLGQFPPRLLPNHGNATPEQVAEYVPFADRFRVQLTGYPSTTVVAHIAKDGHYYIHPDPSQCRSLTVREAARLQTFPDNYFFEGNRTQQYTQIGNAVPPWLARKIAEIVLDFLTVSRHR
ncbi:DNA cytosine methyltransferase [Sulfuricella sp.]|uniref:DNA cytosine methyltransferase n=1 Tax=Sulfuricella sp. TaxID=2099377 RepID=UPI002B707B2F|nr:DNA cytosine methyltransferase [Sulfuricella sp.]HUX63167.1 DNA cytosine methyltransferase [Sulfuricella sp.]